MVPSNTFSDWVNMQSLEMEQLMQQFANWPANINLSAFQNFLEGFAFLVWEHDTLLYDLQRNIPAPLDNTIYTDLLRKLRMLYDSDSNTLGQKTTFTEVYARGMESCGANARPLRTFLARTRRGESLTAVLRTLEITEPVKAHILKVSNYLNSASYEQKALYLTATPFFPSQEKFYALLDDLDKQHQVLLLRARYFFDLYRYVYKPILADLSNILSAHLQQLPEAEWKKLLVQAQETAISRAKVIGSHKNHFISEEI